MMKLIFLGPPGAGKGTQAAIVSKKLGIPSVSTGDMLRAAVKEGTKVGLEAKSFMDAGKLVPDEVIIGIVHERLEKAGIAFDHVISLEVHDEAIVERMSGRRVCNKCGAPFHVANNPPKVEGVCDACGGELIQRVDDKAETVRHRLEVYHQETEPLKSFYQERGVLDLVPGDLGTIEETTAAIMKVLEA